MPDDTFLVLRRMRVTSLAAKMATGHILYKGAQSHHPSDHESSLSCSY